MAALNTTAFAVRSAAFRVHFSIRDSTDGNPLTGGLTGLAGLLSKDGGNFAATTNAPVEIQTSGYGYIDLTAAEMDFYGAVLTVTASNGDAVEWAKEIVTGGINSAAEVWSVAREEFLTAPGRADTKGEALDQLYAEKLNYKASDGSTIDVYAEGAESTADTIIMTRGTGRETNQSGLQTIILEELR